MLRYRLWAIDTIIRRSVGVRGWSPSCSSPATWLIAAAAAGIASDRVGVLGRGGRWSRSPFAPVRRAQSSGWSTGCSTAQRSDPYRALTRRGPPARRGRGAAATCCPPWSPRSRTSLRLPYVAIERRTAPVLAAHGSAGRGRRALAAGVPGHAGRGSWSRRRAGARRLSTRGTARCSRDLARQAGAGGPRGGAHRRPARLPAAAGHRARGGAPAAAARPARRARPDADRPRAQPRRGPRRGSAPGRGRAPYLAAREGGGRPGDHRPARPGLRPAAAGAGRPRPGRRGAGARRPAAASRSTVDAGRPAGPARRRRGGRVPDRGGGDQQRRTARRRPALHRPAGGRRATTSSSRSTDDGRSAAAWTPGVGLTAMRERAEELGGSLTRRPDGRRRRRRPCVRHAIPLPGVAGDRSTVLIADDHPLVRQGLRAVLGSAGGHRRAGRGERRRRGGPAGRASSRRTWCVMDLQMPGLHGIEATRRDRRPAAGDRGAGAHDVRRRRHRLRGGRRRRGGLPAQGRGRRGHRHRDPRRRGRPGGLRRGAGPADAPLAGRRPGHAGAAVPAAHRTRAADPRRGRRRADQRADRPAALPVRQDGRQQRVRRSSPSCSSPSAARPSSGPARPASAGPTRPAERASPGPQVGTARA